MPDHIITAKCIDHAFDSPYAEQYWPNDQLVFNVTTGRVKNLTKGTEAGFTRQLFWLKTVSGRRWVMEFDRSTAGNTHLRLWFCKECGQPFDRLSDSGNHANSAHNKMQNIVAQTQKENADKEEEEMVARQLEKEKVEQVRATALQMQKEKLESITAGSPSRV